MTLADMSYEPKKSREIDGETMKLNMLFILLLPLAISCANSSFSGGNSTGAVPQATSADAGSTQSDNVFETLAQNGIDDAESLALACNNAAEELKSSTQRIVYSERENCSFGVGGNLAEKNSSVTARETTPQTISVPKGAVICNLSLKSEPNAQLRYDDFLFLTIEDKVIFGSNDVVTKRFDQKEQIYQWDWQKIAGFDVPFNTDYYCLGDRSKCVLPPHDQSGPVSIDISTKDVAPLAFDAAGKESLSANLIATGDNDDEDCMHTELQLDVAIEYIQL